MTVHTVDEALERFELISGTGDGESTACVMTAVSWLAGESWSDTPSCAHPLIRSMAIKANDAKDTTPEMRAELLRTGAPGIIDTWWVPTRVILLALSGLSGTSYERTMAMVKSIADWKAASPKPEANLDGADLGRADLGGAYLARANLAGADLARANLAGADLARANLVGADLVGADLGGAYLGGAYLGGADLGGADLGGADLGGAYLGGAYLGGADLSGAKWNKATVWPDGFTPPS